MILKWIYYTNFDTFRDFRDQTDFWPLKIRFNNHTVCYIQYVSEGNQGFVFEGYKISQVKVITRYEWPNFYREN